MDHKATFIDNIKDYFQKHMNQVQFIIDLDNLYNILKEIIFQLTKYQLYLYR